MTGQEQAPTHAAVVELREERVVVREAYDFLDEKRLLLAAEILQQLERYEALADRITGLADSAGEQLRAAACRHGLQGLSVYPATPLEDAGIDIRRRNFMGVTLVETDITLPEPADADTSSACNPSTEAEQCRAIFRELLQLAALQAGLSGNLHRLSLEYRLTERRARALENVILPEIEQNLKVMTAHLEEREFEDVMRVHLQARN
ncbi:MAG: V-type ATP synthase subunit D [Thiohalobacterales bacterium]|nr:V-type ATP synthase subunit D [Thiohalobacterales bacterium]